MHAIQNLRFELRADAVPQARRLPERLSALCRQQLAVVLEEVFAAHCPPHQLLRLPQLVLELPAIADRRLEAELPDLLRRALHTALAQLGNSEKTTITTTPEATSWLEVLEHFLRYGRLPWQVAAGSFSLDEVLRSVVENQAAAFRALLVRLGQTAQRRQRLVWQLNADQLQLLLVVLEPTHAPFLHAYVLATLAAHRRQPLTPVTATALRSIIYELVLADLLLHAGTAFNRRAFLERQVRRLAAQYNLSFTELLRQLVAAELALTPRTQSALSVLLEDLHQRYRLATAPGEAAATAAGQRSAPGHIGSGALGGVISQAAGASQPTITGVSSAQRLESLTDAAAITVAMVARAAAGTATSATARAATSAGNTAAGTTAAAAGSARDATAELAATDFSANPAAALNYFLQHGSLPLAAPARTAQQLLASFPAWLTQGWRVLRPALQAGGPAALHRLAHLLPESMLVQVLRLAAPGQLRPVQGVMEAVWQQPATRAAGTTRPDLWEYTLSYLLREGFRTFSSPAFQQWLVQELLASAADSASALSQTTTAAANALATSRSVASAANDAIAAQAVDNQFFARNAAAAGPAAASSSTSASSSAAASNASAASAADAGDSASDSNVFSDNQRLAARQASIAGGLAAQSTAAANAPAAGTSPAVDNLLAAHNAPGTSPAFADGNTAAAGPAPGAADALISDGTPAATAALAARNAPAASRAFTLLQAQEVIQFHLAEGATPPWWPGGPASPARLRALLAQVLRERPLPAFLRTQALTAAAQQRLVALADFPQLAGLLAARRLSSGSAASVTALAGLERRETTGAAGHASGWLLLLRSAYLRFSLKGGRTTGLDLSEIRHLAAVYQLPLPATLGKIRRLLGAQPALLVDAFFAHLNQLLPIPVVAPGVRVSNATANLVANAANRATQNALRPAENATEGRTPFPQDAPDTTRVVESTTGGTPDTTEVLEKTSGDAEKTSGGAEKASGGAEKASESADKASRGIDKTSGEVGKASGDPKRTSGEAENILPLPEQTNQVAERLTEIPTGVAARDLVFYLLRHQQAPWWAPAGLTLLHQQQLLTRVAHEYRAGLQALVQAQGRQPAFRQALAERASFAQLARFVSKPGQAGPGRLAPAVLAALDQQLARAGEPVARLLRQAYLTAAFQPNPADIRTLAAEVRAQAARTSTAWRTVLRYVAWLHRQLPALATAPFFAALLAAAATYEPIAGQSPRPSTSRARSRPRAAGSAQHQSAATAFQELEEYLRTGQPPTLPTGGNAGRLATGDALATGTSAAEAASSSPSVAGNTTASGSPAARQSAASGTLPQLLAARWKLLLRPEHRATLQPLRPLLASRTVRSRLLAGLAEAEFWQLLRQLYPSHYRLAFRLAADWQLLARQGLVKLSAPALFEVLLALVQATPVASWRPEAAVQALLTAEEVLWPQPSPKRAHSRAGQLLAAIGRRGLVLRGPLGALLLLHQQAGQVARPAPPPSAPIPFIKEEDRPLETVYLANAGLVLLWPFLTMLFDRLGYLENQQFRDETSRQRAALLLQFLASGALEMPEYQLPLNKLLCGVPQGQPLPRELALTAAETELGESLLKAVIARWDALKNTSIAGLRETFLLRAGKLDWLPDDRIVLTVEPKTLDILLDRRPWSISIIKLPWMAAPLYVTWR